MRVIDPAGFEALFQKDIDPWNYAGAPFEAHKRGILLNACGCGIHGRGLELACANGETTCALASRCLRLLAVDSSPTAVAEARQRTAALGGVTVRRALLPHEIPRGPFDLIVVSELLYYLCEKDADHVVKAIAQATPPGGRIVLLHHHVVFDDTSQNPGKAQVRAERTLGRRMKRSFFYRNGRFSCSAFLAK